MFKLASYLGTAGTAGQVCCGVWRTASAGRVGFENSQTRYRTHTCEMKLLAGESARPVRGCRSAAAPNGFCVSPKTNELEAVVQSWCGCCTPGTETSDVL